jgi:hypothetical protein
VQVQAVLAGVATYKAHFVTVHALECHKLCGEFVAVNGFLGAVANGTGQKAVPAAHSAGRTRVSALHIQARELVHFGSRPYAKAPNDMH